MELPAEGAVRGSVWPCASSGAGFFCDLLEGLLAWSFACEATGLALEASFAGASSGAGPCAEEFRLDFFWLGFSAGSCFDFVAEGSGGAGAGSFFCEAALEPRPEAGLALESGCGFAWESPREACGGLWVSASIFLDCDLEACTSECLE